jgi:tRNA A-37 threonylcarbamoyl transferase component Bud32
VTVPEGFVEVRKGSGFGWVTQELAELGIDPYWGELRPLEGVKGRGGVGVLTIADREVVVRPLRRGGALARLLVDRHASSRRVLNEIETLIGLRSQGVPAVVPIAAVARRHGVYWRMRLCTERAVAAVPLPLFLAEHPDLRRFTAEAVGTLLKLAFAAGLRHPDLHLDNIICARRGDLVRAQLVDLDRARLEKPLEQKDTDGMLVRMARYIVRHHKRMPAVPTRPERLRMLRALGLDRTERKQTYRRLDAKLQRALARRRWLGKK